MDEPQDSPVERKSSALAVIVSSALCVLVLAAVVYGAMRGREEAATPRGDGNAPIDEPVDGSAGRHGRQPRVAPEGCGSIDPANPPKLAVDLPATGLAFGPLKQDVVVERKVAFRNSGRGLLCILDVSTGCGCLKSELVDKDKRKYAPGEAGEILVRIDTKEREGLITKSFKITTNEIDAPIKEFPVSADVSKAIVVAPPKLLFGRLPRLRPIDRVLSLRSPLDDPEWKVTEIVGTRRTESGERVAYTFDVKEVEDPRFRKIELTIHHPGLSQEGTFRDPLVIRTTHPERPEIVVQSYLDIVPRIIARPQRVSLGYVRSGGGKPPTRVRFLPGAPDIGFEITGVDVEPRPGREFGPAGSGFDVVSGRDSAGPWIDIGYDRKTRKPGLIEATIVVQVSDPDQPEVRISVTALVRDK